MRSTLRWHGRFPQGQITFVHIRLLDERGTNDQPFNDAITVGLDDSKRFDVLG